MAPVNDKACPKEVAKGNRLPGPSRWYQFQEIGQGSCFTMEKPSHIFEILLLSLSLLFGQVGSYLGGSPPVLPLPSIFFPQTGVGLTSSPFPHFDSNVTLTLGLPCTLNLKLQLSSPDQEAQ